MWNAIIVGSLVLLEGVLLLPEGHRDEGALSLRHPENNYPRTNTCSVVSEGGWGGLRNILRDSQSQK